MIRKLIVINKFQNVSDLWPLLVINCKFWTGSKDILGVNNNWIERSLLNFKKVSIILNGLVNELLKVALYLNLESELCFRIILKINVYTIYREWVYSRHVLSNFIFSKYIQAVSVLLVLECSLKKCLGCECLAFSAKLDWLTTSNVFRVWVDSGIFCQTQLADNISVKYGQVVSVFWYFLSNLIG